MCLPIPNLSVSEFYEDYGLVGRIDREVRPCVDLGCAAPALNGASSRAVQLRSYAKRMSHLSDAFSDAQGVARYAEDPPRKVLRFADLQRMRTLLLEERAAKEASILVLGASGGLDV